MEEKIENLEETLKSREEEIKEGQTQEEGTGTRERQKKP